MPKNNKQARLVPSSKAALAAYLLMLLWLVLFKFSSDIISILESHQVRGLDVIPFTGQLREMVYNLIVFIPFGLLLSVNWKQVTFWQKLATISIFSLAVEAVQFLLAIGITDITDVLMNTAGGLVGLTLYALGKRYIDPVKLDFFINIASLTLIGLFLVLRFFVFRVKY